MIGCGAESADVPDAGHALDAAPIARTDRSYLIRALHLPRTVDEVEGAAFDYDGSGRSVNQIGGLSTVLLDLLEGVPVEDAIASAYSDGEALHVLTLRSGALADVDPSVVASWGDAVDGDEPPDPSNNFEGGAAMRAVEGSFVVIGDSYALDVNTLEGSGHEDVVVGIGLRLMPDSPPALLSGGFVHLRGDVTEDEVSFALGTLTTVEALQAELYPTLAEVMTHAIEIGSPRSSQISGLFDANADGQVTLEELIGNDQLATLAKPDVDTDGDGLPDHISQGIVIEGARVELIQ